MHLDGVLKNLDWVQHHCQSIADLSGTVHPEMVDWCKALYDLAAIQIQSVTEFKGLI